MSLGVYLEAEDGEELYSANITHNLGKMAIAADPTLRALALGVLE